MSKNLQLEHYCDVMPNNKEEVTRSLIILSDCDCDFNGENGLGYLWEDAEGFDSNQEYCLSIAEKESTPRAMIEKFISLWMGKDQYYYDYDLEIIVENGQLFMSLAYIIGGI